MPMLNQGTSYELDLVLSLVVSTVALPSRNSPKTDPGGSLWLDVLTRQPTEEAIRRGHVFKGAVRVIVTPEANHSPAFDGALLRQGTRMKLLVDATALPDT
jgi:hypothetical protein